MPNEGIAPEIGNYHVTAQNIRTGVIQVDKPFTAPVNDPSRVDRMARETVFPGLPFNDTFRVTVYRVNNGKRFVIDRWLAA